MAETNPCFYLKDSKTPGSNWTVLWYHPNGEGSTRRDASIKIDILLPGDAELPSLDPYWIDYSNEDLPAAPLLLVLLHKVLGWWEHFNSAHSHHYQKHYQDARDVENLLILASEMGVTIDYHVLPHDFIDSAKEWVKKFIAEYPDTQMRYHWRQIGFRTRARARTRARGTRSVATS